MRIFAFLLLILNIGLFYYGNFHLPAGKVSTAPDQAAKGKLLLWDEIDRGLSPGAPTEAEDTATDQPFIEQQTVSEAEVSGVSRRPDPEPAVDLNMEVAADLSQGTAAVSSVDVTVTEDADPVDIPISQPADSRPMQPAQQTVPGAPADAALPEEICGTLSRIETEAELKRIVAMFSQNGIQASSRQGAEQIAAGYWVMIPPLNNRQEAASMERRLRQNGITDLSRFTRGKHENAISLGVYSRKWNAENRRKSIMEKGFPAQVRERTVSRPSYSVDFRGAAEAIRQKEILSGMEGYEYRESPCR